MVSPEEILPSLREKCTNEGTRARVEGVSYTENPYDPGMEEHEAWAEGWAWADNNRMGNARFDTASDEHAPGRSGTRVPKLDFSEYRPHHYREEE